ncbi:MAG: DNA repair protein RecN [Actinomycetaceae bacterium]|nr:DNA repair protein RecN [Actinomycetaceae bacterium]
MIESLRIENLGVIAEAQLDLEGGLTALTGETGAGKTMALTSLELILGGKADPAKVRAGADYARVEGAFAVEADSPVLQAIDDVGGVYDVEDGQAAVVIARQIPAKGRSSSFIGGRRVPTAVLREIAQDLVTVHGQSDQIRLATAAQQRKALDAFGGKSVDAALRKWRQAYDAHAGARARLEEFEASARDHARQRIAFQALLAKVDEVGPERGEEETLKQESRRLENIESHFTALSQAAGLLAGSDTVDFAAVDALAAAARSLEELSGDDVEEVASRLSSLISETNDIAATLATMAGQAEAQPERLSDIYARRQELGALRHELGMGIEEALDAAEEARHALELLGDPQAARERLEEDVARAEEAMRGAGAKLHAKRVAAAKKLTGLVREELAELALSGADFDIDVREAEPAAHGSDAVTFLLSSHRGAPLSPLGSGASGGELSRVMLAVEVSLAEQGYGDGHTFLFDEVDAGVGGRAALAVGKRLAKLAGKHQVIVVTHLAQVAAYASTQAVVTKEENATDTKTEVRTVAGDKRLGELARMLSGSDSQTARAHASELLADVNVAR